MCIYRVRECVWGWSFFIFIGLMGYKGLAVTYLILLSNIGYSAGYSVTKPEAVFSFCMIDV